MAASKENQSDPAQDHASSTPDQASQEQKDNAPLVVAPETPEPADNEIERKTREMAAAGVGALEIAAYREEAMRKIGDAPEVKTSEGK